MKKTTTENDLLPSPTPTLTPGGQEVFKTISEHTDLIKTFREAIDREGTEAVELCLCNYRDDPIKEETIGLVVLEFMRNSSISIPAIEKLFDATQLVFGKEFLQEIMINFVAQRVVGEFSEEEFKRILPVCQKYTPGLIKRSDAPDMNTTMDQHYERFCADMELAFSSSTNSSQNIKDFVATKSTQMSKEVFGAIFTAVIMELSGEKKYNRAGNLIEAATHNFGKEWMDDRLGKVRLALSHLGRQNDFAELMKTVPHPEASQAKRVKASERERV